MEKSKVELVQKNYKLPAPYVEALLLLRRDGYTDDQSLTETSAIRKAIRDAFEKRFPGLSFPGG